MNLSNTFHLAFVVTFALAAGPIVRGADDRPISPFPSDGYGSWKPEGAAFSNGPARGEQLKKLEIENVRASAVASSEIEGDAPTGTLIFPCRRRSGPGLACRYSRRLGLRPGGPPRF